MKQKSDEFHDAQLITDLVFRNIHFVQKTIKLQYTLGSIPYTYNPLISTAKQNDTIYQHLHSFRVPRCHTSLNDQQSRLNSRLFNVGIIKL